MRLKITSPVFIYNLLRLLLENGFKKQKQILRDSFIKDSSGSRILDLGCGTGTYTGLFNPDSYFGLEINLEYIKDAKQHKEGNFVRADGSFLPFKNDTFGQVCSIAVFHHLPTPQILGILREIKRVVLPGGLFLLMDQSEISVNLSLDWLFRLIRYFDKGKFIRRPEDNLEILTREPGFKIIDNWTFRSGLITYQAILVKKE